jgi:hypothetical protein
MYTFRPGQYQKAEVYFKKLATTLPDALHKVEGGYAFIQRSTPGGIHTLKNPEPTMTHRISSLVEPGYMAQAKVFRNSLPIEKNMAKVSLHQLLGSVTTGSVRVFQQISQTLSHTDFKNCKRLLGLDDARKLSDVHFHKTPVYQLDVSNTRQFFSRRWSHDLGEDAHEISYHKSYVESHPNYFENQRLFSLF